MIARLHKLMTFGYQSSSTIALMHTSHRLKDIGYGTDGAYIVQICHTTRRTTP